MPISVITFGFDPILRLGPEVGVRWQSLALAAAIVAVLSVAGVMARRSGLRADDLLSIAIAAVPGAVLVGRAAWIASHPGIVPLDVWSLLDPGLGGVDLAAAVAGGALTGGAIAALLGAPVGRWADLLAVPLLVAIGLGKVGMVLGGSGQGLPVDQPWSTAYVGPGPWSSLAPDLPSHPSQLYEAGAALLLAAILASARGEGTFRWPDGRLLGIAIVAWCLARCAISVTWRDPVLAGPLSASGWLALVVAVAAALVTVAGVAMPRDRRPATASPSTHADDLAWPDPKSRTRF